MRRHPLTIIFLACTLLLTTVGTAYAFAPGDDGYTYGRSDFEIKVLDAEYGTHLEMEFHNLNPYPWVDAVEEPYFEYLVMYRNPTGLPFQDTTSFVLAFKYDSNLPAAVQVCETILTDDELQLRDDVGHWEPLNSGQCPNEQWGGDLTPTADDVPGHWMSTDEGWSTDCDDDCRADQTFDHRVTLEAGEEIAEDTDPRYIALRMRYDQTGMVRGAAFGLGDGVVE